MSISVCSRVAPRRETRRLLHAHKGATLIEVLVAALLLAGALVAMIGVYSTSTRQTKLNEYRSIATNLAINFTSRIQANASPTGANWTAYSDPQYSTLTAYSPQSASAPEPITTRPTGSVLPDGTQSVESLSPSEWAAYETTWNGRARAMAVLDLQEMRNAVRTQLPYGAMHIVVNTPTGKGNRPTADMWLMWLPAESERSEGGGIDPRCPNVTIQAGYFPECLYFRVVL